MDAMEGQGRGKGEGVQKGRGGEGKVGMLGWRVQGNLVLG